jgi:large subunit ribosomal protein L35
MLEHKSSRVTRRLTGTEELSPADRGRVKKLLGR